MTGPDERPPALVAAESGAEAWRAVAVAQRAAVAGHGDFYALAGDVVATLRALSAVAGVLAVQVAGYGDGRVLRDDAGHDPAARLAEAAAALALVQCDVDRAERAANRFWSEISHIAVEVAP
jgi:hypothetical protein